MPTEVKLPSLGDGIESGDVLDVLVQEGDQITKDQGIVEVETDKASVAVPSPIAGKVLKIHVSNGQTVPIGGLLLTVEADGAGSQDAAAAAQKTDGADPGQGKTGGAEPGGATNGGAANGGAGNGGAANGGDVAKFEQIAAGEDPSLATPGSQDPRTGGKSPTAPDSIQAGPAKPAPRTTPVAAGPAAARQVQPAAQPPAARTAPEPPAGPVPAGPAIRRFAREVGVDLTSVEGTGDGGRITRDDVLEVVRRANQAAQPRVPLPGATAEPATSADQAPALPGIPAQDAWGPVSIEPATKIRRTIATRMSDSWSTVPRVTNFDDADVTELEKIRQSSKDDYKARGIRLTSMPFVVKAVSMALRNHPVINASLDMEQGQIVYKQYINVGVAVDTERGLVVPVLRNSDRKSIADIAKELSVTAERVRTNDFSIDDLRGGTFTISNLGAIGGRYSTPIVNLPEVAILLVGRTRKMPVVVDDQVAVRLMMPLSLSYDHRLVDGAAAARFLNDVIDFLQAPGRLLLAP